LDTKGYGNTDRATILKALSAVQLDSVQDRSLRTLRELKTNEIEALTTRTGEALRRAVDTLSTQFHVHSWDFLSYEAILLIVAYIFRDVKELSGDQAARLRRWFWRSSFGERY